MQRHRATCRKVWRPAGKSRPAALADDRRPHASRCAGISIPLLPAPTCAASCWRRRTARPRQCHGGAARETGRTRRVAANDRDRPLDTAGPHAPSLPWAPSNANILHGTREVRPARPSAPWCDSSISRRAPSPDPAAADHAPNRLPPQNSQMCKFAQLCRTVRPECPQVVADRRQYPRSAAAGRAARHGGARILRHPIFSGAAGRPGRSIAAVRPAASSSAAAGSSRRRPDCECGNSRRRRCKPVAYASRETSAMPHSIPRPFRPRIRHVPEGGIIGPARTRPCT